MKSYFYAIAAFLSLAHAPLYATDTDGAFAPEGHAVRVSVVNCTLKQSKIRGLSHLEITLPKEEKVAISGKLFLKNKPIQISDLYHVGGLKNFTIHIVPFSRKTDPANGQQLNWNGMNGFHFFAVPKEGKTMGDVEAVRIELDLVANTYRALFKYLPKEIKLSEY